MKNKEVPVHAFIIEEKHSDVSDILIIKNVDDVLCGSNGIFTNSQFTNKRLNVDKNIRVGSIGFMVMHRSGFTVDYDVDKETSEYLFNVFFEYYKKNDPDICRKMITEKRNISISKLI